MNLRTRRLACWSPNHSGCVGAAPCVVRLGSEESAIPTSGEKTSLETRIWIARQVIERSWYNGGTNKHDSNSEGDMKNMPYPEFMIAPMREELTRFGVE